MTPPELIDTKQVRVTEAVRQGVTYTTANGGKLPNLGEIDIEGVTDENTHLNLTFQVAGVKKSLGSVRKMCAAGNRVVFEDISEAVGGYVENKSTGARIPINKEGSTYGVTVWRLMKSGKPAFSSGNHFEALSEDEEEDEAEKEVAGATGAASSSSTGFRRHA